MPLEAKVRRIIKPYVNQVYLYSEDGPYVIITTGGIFDKEINGMKALGYSLAHITPCILLKKKPLDSHAITYYFVRDEQD